MKRITYRSFNSARKHAHSLKLKNRDEWKAYCDSGKNPNDIPKDAGSFYKKQGTWKGWGDFLGTGNLSSKDLSKQFLPPKEAKIEARKRTIVLKKFIDDLKLEI